VSLEDDGSSCITVFSKSKRDSTLDRHTLHDIIRQAIGLNEKSPEDPYRKRKIRKNIILDAEMVAFRGTKIEGSLLCTLSDCNDNPYKQTEFWHIRRLIENTAVGIRYRGANKNPGSKVLGK